ncbi:MAG: caspase family protein [Candidatus Brocadiia bacterium]
MSRRWMLAPGLLLIAALAGCGGPVVKMPDSHPPIVKTYRSFTIHAGSSGMKNTGVRLEKGELYSLFATGEMDYCPRGTCGYRKVTPDMGWPLVTRVGDGNYWHPLHGMTLGTLSYANRTGDLYMGYRAGALRADGTPVNPEFYRNDSGAFHVDIVVWAWEDYAAIVAFLEDLARREPENHALKHCLAEVKTLKSIHDKVKTAEKAIEITKTEIASLKADEKPPEPAKESDKALPAPTPSVPKAEEARPQDDTPLKAAGQVPADPDREARIAALEARLAKLQDIGAEFDRMKQTLAEEQKKSEQLAQEIGEMAQREEDLRTRIQEVSKTPPLVVIASPEDGSTVEVNIIGLRGVVEDDQEIVKIEIFINGRPLHRDSDRGLQVVGDTSGRRLSFLEQVPLQEGENRIRVRAVNADGLATEKIVTIQCVKQRKNIWAVVIGINEYAHVRPLQYAVNDARAFYRHLVDHMGIPEENITLLLDKEAHLSRLRTVLGTQLKSRAGEEDMVILYFAGHGATERDVMSPDGDGLEKYLLPYGADMKDLYASALPMREIQHIFNRIRSQRLVFVVDSCYSGASGGRTISMAGIRANISDAFMERIASGKGRVILSASGANEVSQEDDEIGHGVFTYYLLEGLLGPADTDGDGLITVDEAYSYVSRRVPEATGQEQNPVKKGSVEGHLVIGVRP